MPTLRSPPKLRQNGLIEKYRSHRSVKRPFSQIRNSAQFNDVRVKANSLNIPILNQTRFLYMVGYYEEAAR